ncbi:hypothetical protein V6N13_107189 [Hibiscus sabdariffa]|uniref:Uncharacterized protein n=1 Tax=Hibiscus sabdariffa TaxID=183260 RepID=A0ABR2F316_9ROSI
MLRFYLCKGFNNLLQQDDKGDVSAETTGPAPAEVSAGTQISAETTGPVPTEVSAGTQISAERLAVLLAYP